MKDVDPEPIDPEPIDLDTPKGFACGVLLLILTLATLIAPGAGCVACQILLME